MATSKAQSNVMTNHDEIRRWAEARDAQPACVRGTGNKGDIGMLRLDFPGYGGEESLQHISWDAWFEKFDERKLALLYQEQTAGGAQSNFNKLVSRGTAKMGGVSKSRTPGRSGGVKHRNGRTTSRPATKKAASKAASKKTSPASRSRTASRGSKTATAKRSRAGGTKRSSTVSKKRSAARSGAKTRSASGRKTTARSARKSSRSR